jgi:2-methylisocitrate lyase-like PEP mutase family enzyme
MAHPREQEHADIDDGDQRRAREQRDKRPLDGPRRLRELLAGREPVAAPGTYDALSARLIEQAGFDAVYMTGFGASASLLGRPDVGPLSFAEMADHARRLAQAVSVPVIADADDGYGNDLNVARTVREYEAAGVAALHIEDQLVRGSCARYGFCGARVLRIRCATAGAP